MAEIKDFSIQLSELAVRLTGMVAERLAWAARDSDPSDRKRILDMIEGSLPTIITNSIAKSPSLHTASGIEYFEQNLENYAETYAKKFVGQI
jgi:hypothetical protein